MNEREIAKNVKDISIGLRQTSLNKSIIEETYVLNPKLNNNNNNDNTEIIKSKKSIKNIIESDIEEKIKKIVPYMSEEFITFDLMEEGDFSPFVNIWLVFDTLPEEIIDEGSLIFKEVPNCDVYTYVHKIGENIDGEDEDEDEDEDIMDELNKNIEKYNLKDKYIVDFSIVRITDRLQDSNLYLSETIDAALYVINYYKDK